MSLAHITLATRDVPASLTFFARDTGLVPDRSSGKYWPARLAGDRAGARIAPGRGCGLRAVSFEAEFGRHIAVAFPWAEFDDLKRRLEAHGATVIEPVRFFFRDPNGYVFEVVDAGRVPEARP